MHLSLKGSMDRQPLTDRLGDKLLAEYGGAAAAYSLRALNGNGDNVVRVRRASDNHEKDFTALQISSGEMTNWVNSQIVPPLDIGVETANGRPSVPEGGTSIGTPAAAYSLRNLSTTYTGNVVEVRRSSDDAAQSFTASEVADGTMEDWVNTDVGLTEDTISTGNNYSKSTGTGTVLSSDTLGFTASGASGLVVTKGGFPQDFVVPAGSELKITYNASGLTGSARILPRQASTGSSGGSPIVLSNGTGNTGTITTTIETNLLIFDGVSGSDVSLEITSLEIIEVDGFVRTWYDQSGNDNHATQTNNAKQPKIVDAGTYLGELDFDGVDDQLSASDPVITASSSGTYSGFSVQNVATTEKGYLYGCASPDNGTSAYAQITEGAGVLSYAVSNTNSVQVDHISRASGENLLSFCYNNGDAGMLVNGGGTMTDVGTYDFATGTGDFIIGNRNGGTSEATLLDGTIKEIIIYNSDQSANRTAIEANIGEHYGISGIPAYDNTVDGFVETWYDQSGNGNDATQTVAGNQPKIVDGGSYLGELDFDGVGQGLEFDESAIITDMDDFSSFTVAKSDITSGTRVALAASKHTPNASRWYAPILTGGNFNFGYGTSVTAISLGAADTDEHLFSATAGTTTAEAWMDGTSGGTVSSVTTSPSPIIGINIGGFENQAYWNGSIKEIIMYDSDQSANRTAIEANINNFYSIY